MSMRARARNGLMVALPVVCWPLLLAWLPHNTRAFLTTAGNPTWPYTQRYTYSSRGVPIARAIATRRLEIPKNLESQFEVFLDQQALRMAIANSTVFQDVSPLDQERAVQTAETKFFFPGQVVFEEGSSANALYLVRNGTFEVVKENQTIAQVSEHGCFGELGLLFGQSRAATVQASRSASKLCSVWEISSQVYRELTKNVLTKIGDRVKENEDYSYYFGVLQRKDALRAFPPFRGLTEGDLQRLAESMTEIPVKTKTAVIPEGNDSLFFVKAGTLQGMDSNGNGIATREIGPGGYVGELEFFLGRKPNETIQATTDDCVVWALSKDSLESLLQDAESSFYAESMNFLQSRLEQKSSLGVLRQLSPQEIYDLLHMTTRPRKKNVSLHSTLASFAVGASALSLIPNLTFRLRPFPMVLDGLKSVSEFASLQHQVVSCLLCIVAMLGHLRFSKKENTLRKSIYSGMTTGMVLAAALGISNVKGSAGLTLINVWSIPGRTLLGGLFLLLIFWTWRMIEALAYDIDTVKLPFFRTPIQALFATGLFLSTTFWSLLPLGVILYSKLALPPTLAAFLQRSTFSNLLVFQAHIWCLYFALGALYGTLTHEGRITPFVAEVFLGLTACTLGLSMKHAQFSIYLPSQMLDDGTAHIIHEMKGGLLAGVLGGVAVSATLNGWRRRIIPECSASKRTE